MNDQLRFKSTDWALILGSSSGFGGATAIQLAKHGMNICGVHFDRAATMPQVEEIKKEIAATGVQVQFHNVNAADPAKRNEVLDWLKKELDKEKDAFVRVLMHSLAFGTLKPYISEKPEEMMTQQQVEMTMDVMANSLVYWTQGAFTRKLLRKGSRIYAMTSSGGRTQIPSYGAVSAAKAALEAHIRQLMMEIGAFGITANAIMAGVTDTPALRKIPAAEKLITTARAKNPHLRLTTPEDIGKAIVLITHEYGDFIGGQIVAVDGGEEVVSYIGQKNARELE
ncbi:MAG: SDR family oxidoreductase [Ignavibacteriales bacterium]|nr:SDR family oxidoreductase [Ignavibacteriales bacterium]